jgi:hypothetical protein
VMPNANATSTVIDSSPSVEVKGSDWRSRSSAFNLFSSVLDYLWSLAIFGCFRRHHHPLPQTENNNNLNEMNNNHMNIDKDEANDDAEDAEDGDDGINSNGDDDDDDGNDTVRFHYTGGNENRYTGGNEAAVPFNVTIVTVDPSVKELGNNTFEGYEFLTTVELPEGLERIGHVAFCSCTLLSRINIPSTVKVIGKCAFMGCKSLKNVELPEGLERLEEVAFADCTSLESINIPPMIKAVEIATFGGCHALQNVDLREGLESIGRHAFMWCPSLRHIKIPSTVLDISPYTFRTRSEPDGDVHVDGLSNLDEVQFCEEMEEFVSALSMRDQWSNGVLRRSLQLYNFLVCCQIPVRLEFLDVIQWQADIIVMLRSIPDDLRALDSYLTIIHAKLAVYQCKEATTLLELAIWKSEVCAQHGPNIGNVSGVKKAQCRDNCGASVIIPNVLSFIPNDLPSLLEYIN